MMNISVTVNGREYVRQVETSATLLRFLREDLGLTGTKEGCEAGECGACTVFLDGRTVNSCLVLAAEADGAEVETIEGEASDAGLSPIQEAFARHFAVQCGYCTGGMIMSVRRLLRDNATPTVEEIREAIEGNLCRCTGYEQIIEAVLDASGQFAEGTRGDLNYV
jgi:aerobic-type carbon monoxide dehydrogenase small subunit (CoxS/CutS family)